jgi:Fe-S cluster assembly scaffold protein SufB
VEIAQVDATWKRVPTAVAEGPLVMPLSQAVEEHGELVDRYLGSVVPVEDDPFVAATRRSGRAARSSTCRATPTSRRRSS